MTNFQWNRKILWIHFVLRFAIGCWAAFSKPFRFVKLWVWVFRELPCPRKSCWVVKVLCIIINGKLTHRMKIFRIMELCMSFTFKYFVWLRDDTERRFMHTLVLNFYDILLGAMSFHCFPRMVNEYTVTIAIYISCHFHIAILVYVFSSTIWWTISHSQLSSIFIRFHLHFMDSNIWNCYQMISDKFPFTPMENF